MRFRAWGVNFALPPLTLIAPLLAARLGLRGRMVPLFLTLSVHELAHLLAAKLLRVEISEIRLMPFGGSARIENPYRLSPVQLLATALAGPAANLALAVTAAALAQWKLLSPTPAAALIRPSLLMMLFNLLPALPLDGGRALFALLRAPLGDRRAQALGIWLGRGLAALLLLAFLAGGLRGGVWNLTLFLASIFLLASGRDESAALDTARAQTLGEALDAATEPRPARIYQLDAHMSAARALALLRPRERAWFVLTDAGRPTGLLDDRSIVEQLLREDVSPDAPLVDLPAYHLTQAD